MKHQGAHEDTGIEAIQIEARNPVDVHVDVSKVTNISTKKFTMPFISPVNLQGTSTHPVFRYF
jgi:hypothetical protein